jgi:acyl dehydratase
MKRGDTFTWKRTFAEQDIRLFGKISGDEGIQHVQTDEQGRLMAQGLLTATLPTKIGGDLNFIAQEMTFHFRRPVYAGDTIECQVSIADLKEVKDIISVSSTWSCRNQHGKEVLRGHAIGIIRQHPE